MIKTKMLFINVVYNWLEENNMHTSLSTYVKYEQLIRNYVKPYFETLECENMSEKNMSDYYKKLMFDSEYANLSNGNIRTIIMIVNKTCEYAYDNHILSTKLYIKPCLTKKRPVVSVLNKNEQKKLENYIYESHDIYSLAILLALYSGMRIGELCALKWSDINFNNGSVTITKTVQRLKCSSTNTDTKTQLVISEPKSKTSYRVIPLPRFVMNYMKDFYKRELNKFIFSNKEDVPMEPRTLQYAYKKILKLCNISYLNFHCLRHTFATRCITTGWDVKTLSEILGHSEIKITMDYYFHSSFEFKKQQMNKLKLIS